MIACLELYKVIVPEPSRLSVFDTLMELILPLTAFVTTLLYNTSVDFWVGLTSDAKGHFKWARGGLLSYTNWAPGQPLDNSGPHHNKTPVLTIFPCQHTFHGFVFTVCLF